MIAASDSVPFWVALVVGLAMIAAAVAILVVMNRAANGTLGPNPGFGIRTKATRSSPEAWQAAHRAARPFTQFGAVVMIACGCVVFGLSTVPEALVAVALIGTGLMVLALLLGTVVAVRAANDVSSGADSGAA